MIYLIRTAMLDPREKDLTKAQPISVFKIGYTSDPEGTVRFNSYKSMGPLEVIATIQEDGPDDSLERLVHKYFSRFCIYGREWYSCEEEIVRFFSSNITGELAKAEIEKDRPELLISPETTRAELEREMIELIQSSNLLLTTKKVLLEYYETSDFRKRMKYLCSSETLTERFEQLRDYLLPTEIGIYYETLGPDKIRALSYQRSLLVKEYSTIIVEGRVESSVLLTFSVGGRYRTKDIKLELIRIYKDIGYSKSAKATDLQKYFNLRRCIITNPETKKKEEGFEILSIKGEEGI